MKVLQVALRNHCVTLFLKMAHVLQVPEDLYYVLKNRGFFFEYRDETWVKGIGKVRTYFLTGCADNASRSAGMDRAMSALGAVVGADGRIMLGQSSAKGGHHSFANIVFSIVQAVQRHKRYEPGSSEA